jgi:hypothetical protein
MLQISIIKLINLIALMAAHRAVAWLARTPSWEPLVTTLGLLATLIGLEVTEPRRRRTEADCQLFQSFLEILPSGGSITFIRNHPMEGAFALNSLNDLYRFADEWSNPEHEFHDKTLEKKRKELLKHVSQYLSFAARNTFPTDTGLQTVPPEWEIDQPERFDQLVRELHSRADEIFELHQGFVRTARKRLGL